MNLSDFQPLKVRLQQFGALRPMAFERVLEYSELTQLKQGETFIRRRGTLAIILSGLLKEHDPTERKTPSVINLIDGMQAFTTRKHNQTNFLKACVPTLIIHWKDQNLQSLYAEYPELKVIYEGLLAEYDERIGLRMRMLELPVNERLETFRASFKGILAYLKRKDMANYLHLNYSHFIRLWNS